mmetsp:Transcript_27856/g.76675  ORF Transcript_27856/g.76675 Transcript_27856/m.76675 type:complete len:90 (-) Transcript_27856:776-1045(-)
MDAYFSALIDLTGPPAFCLANGLARFWLDLMLPLSVTDDAATFNEDGTGKSMTPSIGDPLVSCGVTLKKKVKAQDEINAQRRGTTLQMD